MLIYMEVYSLLTEVPFCYVYMCSFDWYLSKKRKKDTTKQLMVK